MPDSSSAPSSASQEHLEEVERSPPGLARGVWELPADAFYAAGAALVVVSALYAARRLALRTRGAPPSPPRTPS